MNILLVNTTYRGGGAEKVTRQLYHGFDDNPEVNMHLIVGRAEQTDGNFDIILDKSMPNFFSRAYGKLASYRKNDKYATKQILDAIDKYNIDIVHLQNIHGNYMGIEDVAEIAKRCRVIWTLHDMWSMTGHCAHAFECTKWIEGNCSNCPKPDTYPAITSDIANEILACKKETFTGKNIVFVSPSEWLKNKFMQSHLKNEKIFVINNGIDVDKFQPALRMELRDKYHIPVLKNVVLFAASNLNSQFRSFPHLLEALEMLEDKKKYCLVVIGTCDTPIKFNDEFEVHQMGYVTDESVMNELYILSDVYITPSLADNFPCTTLESFASGTPVIAFASGGLTEQIDETCGLLVEPGNSKELAQAITTAFSDKQKLREMGLNCRLKSIREYSEKTMLKKYTELYQKMLKGEI